MEMISSLVTEEIGRFDFQYAGCMWGKFIDIVNNIYSIYTIYISAIKKKPVLTVFMFNQTL